MNSEDLHRCTCCWNISSAEIVLHRNQHTIKRQFLPSSYPLCRLLSSLDCDIICDCDKSIELLVERFNFWNSIGDDITGTEKFVVEFR